MFVSGQHHMVRNSVIWSMTHATFLYKHPYYKENRVSESMYGNSKE